MLAKPTVTGAMMLAIVVAFASGWWQRDTIQRAHVPEIAPAEVAETSEDVAEDTEAATDADEPEERTATAPARVVDSAGFPVTDGPIVTVNGRPLGTDEGAEAQPARSAASDQRPAPAESETETETAAVETPPVPVPRPADLPEPPRTASAAPTQAPVSSGQHIDYEAITATAHGQEPRSNVEFLSREERQRLAPIPERPDYGVSGGHDPRQDGLVQVVTANGDVIWVYEDQVDRQGQGAQLVGPVNRGSNPLGFVYDSFDYRW